MCTKACSFNRTVRLPILHVKCAKRLDNFTDSQIRRGGPIALAPHSPNVTPRLLTVGMHDGKAYATKVRDSKG
jgi:hypothetical protein